MTAAVLVPLDLRDDAGERAANWEWLERRYQEMHPTWRVVTCPMPTGAGAWSKGRAVNSAADVVPDEVLVVADADVAARTAALTDAVDQVTRGEFGWAVPFGDVYRLNPIATRAVLDAPPTIEPEPLERRDLDPQRPAYRGKPGGGLVVIHRDAWAAVAGFDERFVGWGGEDFALAHALRVCVGPPLRIDRPLWHLWHPPQPGYDAAGRLPDAARALLRRYRHATRDAVTMRALIGERTGGEPVGCGCGGVTPEEAAAPRQQAKCLTCGVSFTNYELAEDHKSTTGHIIEGLRGLRAAARRQAVDPFLAATP